MIFNNLSWTEKYRPKYFNQIINQKDIINIFENTIECGNIPHCVLYGPPGIGKTSTALILCYKLFGPLFINQRILELNASDERGIKVVRDKIKTFVKKKINTNIPENYKYICPNFKILILDEADTLTDESQMALRRIMEQYSINTRFILICNYISKINYAIISRCSEFHFKPIDNKEIYNILNKILEKENININKKNLNSIINYSNGDLRKTINMLQKYKFLNNFNNGNLEINNCINIEYLFNKLIQLKKYKEYKKLISIILKINIDTSNFFKIFSNKLLNYSNINKEKKILIFIKISKLDYLLDQKSNQFLILLNFLIYLNYILCYHK